MIKPSKKFIVVFTLAIFLTLFSSQNVFACSCGNKPTLLDSLGSSKSVVVAKVVSVEKSREKDKNDKYDHYYIKSIKMVVEKTYKGDIKVDEEITLGQGSGSDCIIVFEESYIGSKMLLYLGPTSKGHPYFLQNENKDSEPMYYVSFCGRSTGIESATADLLYLDKLNKVRGKTRISGKLDSWKKGSPNFTNVDIKITGKDKTYRVKTDKKGVFEKYDLPKGSYTIEPQIPKGWKIGGGYSRSPNEYSIEKTTKRSVTVGLKEKEHTEVNFSFVYDNSISGRIISPTGKPMKKVRVTAVSVNSDKLDSRGYSDSTNEKGEFYINTISPGNYNLVVNGDGKIDNDEPFEKLFYPGVSNRKNAGVVTIELGKFLKNFDIQIPQTIDLIQIKGKFLYSDGKPVAKEDIKFMPTNKEKYDKIETESDEQGNFSLQIPAQAKGILFGDMYIYPNKFKNCEKLEQIIKKKEDKYFDITTNKLKIGAVESLLNVELIFPFPRCDKKY